MPASTLSKISLPPAIFIAVSLFTESSRYVYAFKPGFGISVGIGCHQKTVGRKSDVDIWSVIKNHLENMSRSSRNVGSPPVIRILRTPSSIAALTNKKSSGNVRSSSFGTQLNGFSGMPVRAREVASLGHRESNIFYLRPYGSISIFIIIYWILLVNGSNFGLKNS